MQILKCGQFNLRNVPSSASSFSAATITDVPAPSPALISEGSMSLSNGAEEQRAREARCLSRIPLQEHGLCEPNSPLLPLLCVSSAHRKRHVWRRRPRKQPKHRTQSTHAKRLARMLRKRFGAALFNKSTATFSSMSVVFLYVLILRERKLRALYVYPSMCSNQRCCVSPV